MLLLFARGSASSDSKFAAVQRSSRILEFSYSFVVYIVVVGIVTVVVWVFGTDRDRSMPCIDMGGSSVLDSVNGFGKYAESEEFAHSGDDRAVDNSRRRQKETDHDEADGDNKRNNLNKERQMMFVA